MSAVSAGLKQTYQIDDFITSMGREYSTKTIANTISLLSSSYERAVKTGQLAKNPCKAATLPKRKKKEIHTFSKDELAVFMQALNEERLDLKVGYELCLLCGLRRSEVLGIQEENVNLLFKQISINKSRHYVDNQDVISSTKTERSHRTLALPDMLVADIENLISEHHAQPFDTTDFLIQDGFGQPMKPNTFTSNIYRIEEYHNLPRITVHGLRHTFATFLNAEGVDIARISAELGHSNINTTLSVYTHVFGGATQSSRGIASLVDNVISECVPNMPPAQNKKA